MKSAYEVLGIPEDSDADAIKAAYNRHAKALHPDVNKRPTATAEFEKLNSAYQTLKDAMKRQEHDYALMRVKAKDVPDDMTDTVLNNFGMSPKKRKKRKKKKIKEVEAVPIQFFGQYQPPPYAPPQYDQGGRGRGEFEVIPPGYDQDQSMGGLF